MSGKDEDKNYIKGRGAQINPKNAFTNLEYVQEFAEGIDDWEKETLKTKYHQEESESIAQKIEAIDIPLEWSLNPYQGCEHGCIYCYARPSHEHYGFSAGTDFESNIIVKHNAPQLLRNLFDLNTWIPTAISLSGNTDPYQPAERQFKLTRQILKICLEYRNPVAITTKNALLLRDIDVLQELQKHNLVQVFTSITATDEKLRLQLEPRTSTYADRFRIIELLSNFNIPVGVLNSPIIPGINDHEMQRVLQRAADVGAQWAGYNIVRLEGPVQGLFKDWLRKNYPDRADKVLNSIKSCHDGALTNKDESIRSVGGGNIADVIAQQFKLFSKKYNLKVGNLELDTKFFRRPNDHSPNLFS
jgi:DNA repair photolyase